MSGPLGGSRVLVLSGMGPVPYVSMLLADMGAQVVRVARPTHRSARSLSQTDGLRDEHDVVNRGVETVELDLKDPRGVQTVLRLAAAATSSSRAAALAWPSDWVWDQRWCSATTRRSSTRD